MYCALPVLSHVTQLGHIELWLTNAAFATRAATTSIPVPIFLMPPLLNLWLHPSETTPLKSPIFPQSFDLPKSLAARSQSNKRRKTASAIFSHQLDLACAGPPSSRRHDRERLFLVCTVLLLRPVRVSRARTSTASVGSTQSFNKTLRAE